MHLYIFFEKFLNGLSKLDESGSKQERYRELCHTC